jgi:hypothetical protein
MYDNVTPHLQGVFARLDAEDEELSQSSAPESPTSVRVLVEIFDLDALIRMIGDTALRAAKASNQQDALERIVWLSYKAQVVQRRLEYAGYQAVIDEVNQGSKEELHPQVRAFTAISFARTRAKTIPDELLEGYDNRFSFSKLRSGKFDEYLAPAETTAEVPEP